MLSPSLFTSKIAYTQLSIMGQSHSYGLYPREQPLPTPLPLSRLPPETISYIFSFLSPSDIPTLASLCLVSSYIQEIALPHLYSPHLGGQNLSGTLRLLRTLARGKPPETASSTLGETASSNDARKGRSDSSADGMETGVAKTDFAARYAANVRSIAIPRRRATHEVKTAIATALAECISKGWFPNLRHLEWPFYHMRRGFLEEADACMFDEPLWKALDERYETL